FFLAVSTPSRDWNDLDLAGSIWKLSLENDRGLRAVPVRIVADRSGSPTLRHFFPDLGHFSMGYWVHFPRDPTVLDPAAAWFRLSLRGPLATVELVWEIGKEGRQEGGQLSELPHSE
ncbi:MAG: hypothetical protein FJ098_04740, partial [Deltaproteobacteria bacterium]|nr:hypothetical protein [Deltaproteobacteria bacterium]